MNIKKIMSAVPDAEIYGNPDIEIKGISYSSQSVRPGYLFAAMKGVKTDGMLFVGKAVENGAAAVLSEQSPPPEFKKVWIRVPDARKALALCSAEFYSHPSHKLKTIGITGTKGKTTITYLLEAVLNKSGAKPGVFGTISYRGPGVTCKAQRTTPEAPEIQQMMQALVKNGATHCILEVSSHALELQRVAGIDFNVAVFTNLSGEHLDYHQTMDNYFEAKKKLFLLDIGRTLSVINTDDPWGKKLKSQLSGGIISYGLEEPAMVRAEEFRFSEDGIQLTIRYPAGKMHISSPLLGRPNVYNILAAAASALAMNISPAKIEEGISEVSGIPGRFEKIENHRGLRIFVDYAHTDDPLRNLLETARELDPKRIILVFGAGGDRDRTKRPRMGRIAGSLADWTIITSDNPRTEDPLAIIAEIKKGIRETGEEKYEVIPDRRQAIVKALQMGESGDIVLIAGKGHEDYQIIGDRVLSFDDAVVVREILNGPGGSGK